MPLPRTLSRRATHTSTLAPCAGALPVFPFDALKSPPDATMQHAGKTMREARTKTNSIIVGAFKTSIPYWTLVNLYIIARVQPQLRPLYGNIASIFWSLYMSSLN